MAEGALGDGEVARELLRIEQAKEARRKTRNEAGIVVAVLLVIALVVGLVVWNQQRQKAADDRYSQELYCAMLGHEPGSSAYVNCVDRG